MLRVLAAGRKQAEQLTDEYLSTEHLLVGLAASDDAVGGLLKRHGATPDALLAAFGERYAALHGNAHRAPSLRARLEKIHPPT